MTFSQQKKKQLCYDQEQSLNWLQSSYTTGFLSSSQRKTKLDKVAYPKTKPENRFYMYHATQESSTLIHGFLSTETAEASSLPFPQPHSKETQKFRKSWKETEKKK